MFKNNFKNAFKSKLKNMMWWNMAHPSSESWLRGLALSRVERLTLVRHTKSMFEWYLSRWLTLEIFIQNDTSQYVNVGHINDIIGEEKWLQGEVNCLCNIASSQIISLSWETKKKEHQKLHHVPYYIDILLNCLGMFNLGIISTFFPLRSYFINLEWLSSTYYIQVSH